MDTFIGTIWNDSLQFLNASLENLMKNLKGKIPITKKEIPPGSYKLLTQKRIYPYEYPKDYSEAHLFLMKNMIRQRKYEK